MSQRTSFCFDEGRCWSSKIFHFLLGRETLLDYFFLNINPKESLYLTKKSCCFGEYYLTDPPLHPEHGGVDGVEVEALGEDLAVPVLHHHEQVLPFRPEGLALSKDQTVKSTKGIQNF